jgi:hypothetical protein
MSPITKIALRRIKKNSRKSIFLTNAVALRSNDHIKRTSKRKIHNRMTIAKGVAAAAPFCSPKNQKSMI